MIGPKMTPLTEPLGPTQQSFGFNMKGNRLRPFLCVYCPTNKTLFHNLGDLSEPKVRQITGF